MEAYPEGTYIPRASWTDTWMRVAAVVSQRSPCEGRQVGAVITDIDNRIIATGYNAFPRGFCDETYNHFRSCGKFCERKATGDRGIGYGNCQAVHAELNALLRTSYDQRRHGSLYVTSVPCYDCCKILANSGIEKIFYYDNPADSHYDATKGLTLLRDILVTVVRMDGK